MAASRYVILTSDDAGETWAHSDVVQSGTADSAIKFHRADQDPVDRQYVAVPVRHWAPRAMQKEIIERWSLQPVPAAGTRIAQEELS